MEADLLADSHAGWKGVVIKMSMSGMCFSSSAVHLIHSQSLNKTDTSRHAESTQVTIVNSRQVLR